MEYVGVVEIQNPEIQEPRTKNQRRIQKKPGPKEKIQRSKFKGSTIFRECLNFIIWNFFGSWHLGFLVLVFPTFAAKIEIKL